MSGMMGVALSPPDLRQVFIANMLFLLFLWGSFRLEYRPSPTLWFSQIITIQGKPQKAVSTKSGERSIGGIGQPWFWQFQQSIFWDGKLPGGKKEKDQSGSPDQGVFFSVTRRSRSNESYSVSILIDLTDVTLVSDDTYIRLD